MKRSELEHIIRAAGSIADCRVLVVIGSQAILASYPEPPPELTVSMEADLYPRNAPELSTLIEGSIGELSPFHQTFGYYADGVGPDTAILPSGWEQRLVPLENENTNGIRALCLSPVDIAVSKLAAGRPKDMRYVAALLRRHLVRAEAVQEILPNLPEQHRQLIAERLTTAVSQSEKDPP